MARVGVVVCIWMAAASAQARPDAAPKPARPVVVRASGSDTVAAYDEVTKLLASADKTSAAGAVRIRLYAAAEKRAEEALVNVKKLKGNGGWRTGLMYGVAGGATLTEEELLRRLDAMRTRAKAVHAELALKQPTAKQPTAKQPTAKQPTAKQPTAKQPTARPAAPAPPRELPACADGLTRCDGVPKCVSLMRDPAHCGDCNTDCNFVEMSANAVSASCVQGTCIPHCAEHAKVCNGRCTDLYYDTSNCGGCAHECPQGAACDTGKCSK